jgi:hypothetical protein
VIALATVKAYCRVTHSLDDTLLQTLLDGAEAEAMRFMNRSELPGAEYTLPEDSSSEPDIDTEPSVAPDVLVAVALLVSMDYDADPDERAKLRAAAECKLMPYRTEMGC